MDNEDYKSLYEKARLECVELKRENLVLKEELNSLKAPQQAKSTLSINELFTTSQKIEIFKALFKGREDIYAYYWQSHDGSKKGYAPARSKDKSQLYPLTDKVLFRHLSGEQLIGIYPLLKDDSCYFLAIDFDKHSWQKECFAVLNTAKELKIPAYLERSPSGNGGHIWIFFEEKISAQKARQLGTALIQRSMDNCPDIDFDSYDRMFPNQDRLPSGGFGNLIALPLYKKARESGNSVFIDENSMPYQDQWTFLTEIKKITIEQSEKIIESFSKISILDFSQKETSSKLPDTKPTQKVNRSKPVTLIIKDMSILTVVLLNQLYRKTSVN